MRDEDDEPTPADVKEPRYRTPPRNSETGHWGVRWIDGVDASDLNHGVKECRGCREKVAILHAVGNDYRRTHCGKCQGAFNRGRV